MKNLEKRISWLESERVAEENFWIVVADEELEDGTLLHNGKPVDLRPAKHVLIIHKRARRRGCDS